MPPASDKPLRKVLLNLYDADVEDLKRIFGPGWTTEVRNIVERHLIWRKLKKVSSDQ